MWWTEGVRPIIVQQSFPAPRLTSNPYTTLLAEALGGTGEVELRTFTWRRALLRRSDVFHAHWTENLVFGHGRLKTLVRQVLFLVLLCRLRIVRTAIVQTVHNVEPPSGLTWIQRRLLEQFARQTDFVILLNVRTQPPRGLPHAVVPHGHYRDWFADYPRPASVPGRFGYFGSIRRYKNVQALVRAFRSTEAGYTLEIAGRPSTHELAADLLADAGPDARVTFRFEFLSDADLVDVASRAAIVVLPYRHMHNSGGVLAALSLDRPVLVPRNVVNEDLAAEVGRGWVFQYDEPLDARDLAVAVEAGPDERAPRPDLSHREWPESARLHVEAYRQAIRVRAR